MRLRTTHDQRGAVATSTLLAVVLGAVIAAGLVAIGLVLALEGGDSSADPGGDPATSATTEASASASTVTEPPAGEPPADADEDAFCEVVVRAYEDVNDQVNGGVEIFDTSGVADDLDQVGTPADAPADARAGFLLYLDVLRAVDGEATADFESYNPYYDLSLSDRADYDAYAGYEAETCL